MVEFRSDSLDPLVCDLGLISGVLTRVDENTLRLNLDWFGDPTSKIREIPKRRAELVSILRRLAGAPISDTPDPERGWEWRSLAGDPASNGAFLVLPKGNDDPAVIAFGLRAKRSGYECYAYAPVFALRSNSDPAIIFGSGPDPIEVCLKIEVIHLHAKIRFDGAPTFVLQIQSERFEALKAFLASPSARPIVDEVLRRDAVKSWLGTKIGQTPLTIGGFLKALGLLEGEYKLASLADLDAKPPAEIAQLLIARALQAFAATNTPIVPLGKGGIYIASRDRDGGKDLGLRAALPNTSLPLGRDSRARLVLQAGAWLSGEKDDSAWAKRPELGGGAGAPGINLMLIHAAGASLSAAPRVELTSLGFDIAGPQGRPLFDIKGVRLDAIESRFSFAIDLLSPQKRDWGGAIRLESIGIPLGSGMSGASLKNPVAQGLLSSGERRSGADNEAINPAFTVSVARMFRGGSASRVALWLLPKQGTGNEKSVVIPVQRALGPLYCHRIHVALSDSTMLSFQIDAAVTVQGLHVDLIGLTLGIPLDAAGKIDRYRFNLQGLDITFESNAVGISAGLLQTSDTSTGKELIRYDGRAVISAKKWSLSALGSFAALDSGAPALFVIAYYRGAIGGPPFFFVTGICAGVGYNRSIRLPPRDDVKKFPLLAGLIDPNAIGGNNPSPDTALRKLGDWIAPLQGSYWFAAGVQFTTYELVKSNAILVVTFGPKTLLTILGVSSMSLPQKDAGVTFAYAELGLEATFEPERGVLQVTALLSPNSFVLDRACRLTGGFALCAWFGSEHNGDFVLTLGGYHPAFRRPPHYPVVPRLGFSWQVSDSVTVTGEAYFALTPTCAMGGGALSIQFHSGNLHAWFNARADFLLQWKPFWYQGSVAVSIGASYRLKLIFVTVTLKVELGASLEIWGPPTGGRVRIDWYVISFTISFGSDPRPPSDAALDWNEFEKLLPQRPPAQLLTAGAGEERVDVCTIAVTRGAIEERTIGEKVWIVRPGTLELAVNTVFPLGQIRMTNGASIGDGKEIAIRPMKLERVASHLDITLRDRGGNALPLHSWRSDVSRAGAAEALWGRPLARGERPPAEANVIAGQLVGLTRLRPAAMAISGPPAFPLSRVMSLRIDDRGALLPVASSASEVDRRPARNDQSINRIRATIAAAKDRRKALADVLGIDASDSKDSMEQLAAIAASAYPNPPMLGALWSTP